MQEVAEGVYVETRYASGNVGLIVTEMGVVCVDVPMLPRDIKDWQAQKQAISDLPIIALVQTDYDLDRVVGPALLREPLIAHDATWDHMKTYSSEKVVNQINDLLRGDGYIGIWSARLPDVTFSERLILYKGKREIHILYGGGHSAATCMVYLPGDSLLFSGDVVWCSMHPEMGQAETKQWLSTLNAIRKMSVDTIVPGHGSCCGKDVTYPLSEYIRGLRAAVRRHFQAGRSKSETSSAVIPEFVGAFSFGEGERDRIRQLVKGGCDRVYDEYRSAEKVHTARGHKSLARSRSRRQKRRH